MAELEALHHELISAAAPNDRDRLEEKNHAFHREINLMADSWKTVWVLGLVTMAGHAELLKGIQAKDPEVTWTAMQHHIVHSGELLAAQFGARVARSDG